MKDSKNKKTFVVLLLLIIAAAFLRLVIGIPNVTPIAAIALFGGTYIKRKELALILPLAILLISDVFIGFYSPVLMAGVYGSFIIIGLLGFLLRKKINILTVTTASVSASVIFFLATNFVVWVQGLWYPMTIEGLISCYYLALPFFRVELISTLAFSLFFFGSYAMMTSKVLSTEKA